MVWVEFVHDDVDVTFGKVVNSLLAHVGEEEVGKSLTGAELEKNFCLFFSIGSIATLHQHFNIETVVSDVVGELLNRLLWPLFDSF